MTDTQNFPDILGYVSKNLRADFGPVQAVMALAPNPVKAGRAVTVVVVLQNVVDAPVEVLTTLEVPERDLDGKPKRFIAKSQRLAIGMQAAEVGMVTLPVTTMPVTVPGIYKLSISLSAKLNGRASRIRKQDGGGAVSMAVLPRQQQQQIETLKKLRYFGAVQRKGGLFGGGGQVLEAALKVEEGTIGAVVDLKADYRTLWARHDLREDPRVLLERHKTAVLEHLLPSLDRTRLLEPLTQHTLARFRDAGYGLSDVEASLIARLMVHIVEYACTGEQTHGRTYLPRSEYEVAPLLQRQTKSLAAPIRLNWLDAILRLMDDDDRIARFATKFLPERCYDPLLHDTLLYAMHAVEAAAGIELGTDDELEKAAEDWMTKLQDGGPLTFADVYLPLVVAGIALHDDIVLPEENIKTLQVEIQRLLSNRAEERTEDNAALFEITRDVTQKALFKYGL